jgi:hypothetical protein
LFFVSLTITQSTFSQQIQWVILPLLIKQARLLEWPTVRHRQAMPYSMLTEMEALPFRLYPNPANNTVVLASDFIPSECTVSLFNLSGQPLLHEQLTQASQEIDLSALPAGAYLVEVSNGEYRSIQRLLKQ